MQVCDCGLEFPYSTCFAVDDEYKEPTTTVEKKDGLDCIVIPDDSGSELPPMMRCDFKKCSCAHEWFHNEPEPMERLSKHVSDATDDYIAKTVVPLLGMTEFPRRDSLDEATSCQVFVLILELDDPQCSLSQWLPQVINSSLSTPAAVKVGVQRFRSRKQFMESILEAHKAISCPHTIPKPTSTTPGSSPSPKGKRPKFKGKGKTKVLAIISSHASSQGQVLACTPASIALKEGFEEFMSLHDAVVALQNGLGSSLAGIHVSSCFALRFDPAQHSDWPVDSSWLTDDTLRCDVSGSANEVYYTGSQTADAHIVLASVSRILDTPTKRQILPGVVSRAQFELFPGLTEEMGLRTLMRAKGTSSTPDDLEDELLRDSTPMKFSSESRTSDTREDPPVSRRTKVCSNIKLLIVPTTEASRGIAEALKKNVAARSDIVTDISIVYGPSQIPDAVTCPDRRLFAVFLGPIAGTDLEQASLALMLAKAFAGQSQTGKPYGMHFAGPIPGQGGRDFITQMAHEASCPVSSFDATCKEVAPCYSIPLLLYLVHLAVGENGACTIASLSSDGVSSDPIHLSTGSWELSDVVAECRDVCPGLSHRTGLILNSPQDQVLSAALPKFDGKPLSVKTRKRKVDFKSIAGWKDEVMESAPKEAKRDVSQQNDLPLSANVKDIRVTHMKINLTIDFDKREIAGQITYHLEPLRHGVDEFVLDMSDIMIQSAYTPGGLANVPMVFHSSPSYVRIARPPSYATFPKVVVVKYLTKPMGRSLLWNGADFVFSCCSPMNNRSLLPCADAPTEQCTYEATVWVPKGNSVIISALQTQVQESSQMTGFTFEMKSQLPPSTIAIAAGKFSSVPIPECIFPKCTIWGTSASQAFAAATELGPRITAFSKHIQELLGPYPYPRYDVVILPHTFSALGLQNPYVAFLAPCMLAGDGSLSHKLAHEMAHGYFGLLIAESDWNEQWLSEGFADYVGERVCLMADGKIGLPEEAWKSGLTAILRFNTLLNDLQNTEDFFQLLKQPKQLGECVERGLEPSFHQIHYLKGYFLLHYLADLAGSKNFDLFLKAYVDKFRDKLLTGKDALKFFFEKFPHLQTPTCNVETIHNIWLGATGVPKDLMDPKETAKRQGNNMVLSVTAMVENLLRCNEDSIGRSQSIAQIALGGIVSTIGRKSREWTSEQISLFLESVNLATNEKKPLNPLLLKLLEEQLRPARMNAEIRHRWCELVIKSRYVPAYGEIERLLVQDQAMGIFLFGELLVGDKPERALARSVINTVHNQEQDPQVYRKMEEMIADARLFTDP